ncbi:glycosyltransferase family 4 protein, partial [candidate division KSB1 bacterium]
YLQFGVFRIWDSFVIGNIIKREKIRIVHTINTNGHVIGSLIRIYRSVRVIWHVHHTHRDLLYRLFRPDYIVFVAEFRREILNRLSRKNRNTVMYNGIDTAPYDRLNHSPEEISTIGYVGRLLPEKGIEDFIDAAHILHGTFQRLKYDIYGEEIYSDTLKGRYTSFLKEKVEYLNLEREIKLRGFVFPQTEIYKSIGICVLPSHREGESCPMVILEAMAAGVPVIVSDVGGIPEIVTHGETGYLVSRKDSQAIADAVSHVIGHPDEVRRIVERARKMVKERFDYRENARLFVSLYRELLGE